jgi:type II secretory pathway component PulK
VRSERTPGISPLNERGIALLIVLLVTALLLALIFEFAYGTRVSLRAAMNFRDSQRAYFLARSGVNFAGAILSDNLKKQKLQDNLEQRDWQVVPGMTGGETELRVRWEDEGGKINISAVAKPNDAYNRLGKLFDLRGIRQDSLDRISEWMIEEKRKFYLVTELHQFLSDEEYRNMRDFVTVSPIVQININTASSEVLQSLGLSAGMAGMIVEKRNREPFIKREDMNVFLGPESTRFVGLLDVTSNVFKVNSFATVGGYTKQIEAVITRSATGFAVSYWRVL